MFQPPLAKIEMIAPVWTSFNPPLAGMVVETNSNDGSDEVK